MSPLGIVIIVVILVLVFALLKYMVSNPYTVQGSVVNGKTRTEIDSESLATDGTNTPPVNFTYSIWFYVNNWNYRYGHHKIIFARMGAKSAPNAGAIDGINGLFPCPAVILGAVENNVSVSLGCHPNPETMASSGGSNGTQSSQNSIIHTCNVPNVPLQRWVNLIMSVYQRTLDVYLDGKLVRTCLLPGIADVRPKANIQITPMGGFDGWTSKLEYWPNSFNPQQAWNTYIQGYKSSIFGMDYQVQVSVLENGSEQSSYTIG